ncbi:MAG: lipoyl(octanoyl) transferase, partial [Cytophagales bacterium]
WLDYKNNSPNPRKICAIGIKSSRWVTMHGLAFNINTDLNYFDNIIPCGIDDKAVTSLANELEEDVNIDEVRKKLVLQLKDLFQFEYNSAEIPVL